MAVHKKPLDWVQNGTKGMSKELDKFILTPWFELTFWKVINNKSTICQGLCKYLL